MKPVNEVSSSVVGVFLEMSVDEYLERNRFELDFFLIFHVWKTCASTISGFGFGFGF